MYLTIPVLISRHFDDVHAKEAGVPEGKERDAREIEFELEKLLAPYDYATTLNISCGKGAGEVEREVPNYGARFDFWDVDDCFSDMFEEEFAGAEVEHIIYPQEVNPGHEVIAASDLPLDVLYHALVTPDGRYHDLWLSKEPLQEVSARRELIIREHTDCLAVICKAHV